MSIKHYGWDIPPNKFVPIKPTLEEVASNAHFDCKEHPYGYRTLSRCEYKAIVDALLVRISEDNQPKIDMIMDLVKRMSKIIPTLVTSFVQSGWWANTPGMKLIEDSNNLVTEYETLKERTKDFINTYAVGFGAHGIAPYRRCHVEFFQTKEAADKAILDWKLNSQYVGGTADYLSAFELTKIMNYKEKE